MARHGILCVLLSIPVLAGGVGCGPRAAHYAAGAEPERDPTSVTVFGERLLLFLEYPHLVRGVPAHFLAHLTVLANGEPVRCGSATLEIGAARFAVDAPKREGLFIPEGSLPAPGKFAGRLIVTSEQAEETLDLGEIVVHASDGEADRAAQSAAGDEPPNAVPFLMEPQWKAKLLLAEAESRTLEKRLIVPGRVVAPEGMSAVVSPPVGGRLATPPSGVLPRTGERVALGQTLALVEPSLGAPDLAQLYSLDLEFDLKALDVLRAAGEAEARLQFAERERERISKLRVEGLSTEQQLDLAEQNLAVAKTELDTSLRMKESIEHLVAKRGGAAGSTPGAPFRVPLAAPIAGSVVEVAGVAGASVEPGAPVFRILDSSRIWFEGRVSEFDVALVREAPGAVGLIAALPGRRFDLRGVRDGRPYIGQEVDASSRTLLVRYEIENSDGAVRPGMLAELHISTGAHEASVAIPIDAVVMDQGLPTAYVMLEGELFQKRDLELGAKDGSWVEVVRGVERGERVATRGAYIV